MSTKEIERGTDIVRWLQHRLDLNESTPIGKMILSNQVLLTVDLNDLLRHYRRVRFNTARDGTGFFSIPATEPAGTGSGIPDGERWTIWYGHLVRVSGDRNITGVRVYDSSLANSVELCEVTAGSEFHFPQDAPIFPLVMEPADIIQIEYAGGTNSTEYYFDCWVDVVKTTKIRDLDGL